MVAPPWTNFQTRGTGSKTKLGTLGVGTASAARLFALVVTSLVFWVAGAPATVLAIQHALARVLGVVYAQDWSRRNIVGGPAQCLTFPASPLAYFRLMAAVHWLVTKLGTIDGGWVLITSDPFRMFTEREFLLDGLLTVDGRQIVELITRCGKNE